VRQLQVADFHSPRFGPTMCGEWSQADTDCAQYINNVNIGSRWEGTYNVTGISNSSQVLSPACPMNSGTCDCSSANANPESFSADYKEFLITFAEAQIYSFEQGWGWFYWTWDTESAPLWSWKQGVAAGILPQKAYSPSWNCNMAVPEWTTLAENY
jgi:glucan 1,3-beta-glucosidase